MKKILLLLLIANWCSACTHSTHTARQLRHRGPLPGLGRLTNEELKKIAHDYSYEKMEQGVPFDSLVSIKRFHDSIAVTWIGGASREEEDTTVNEDGYLHARSTYMWMAQARLVITSRGTFLHGEVTDTIAGYCTTVEGRPDSASYVTFDDSDSVMIAMYNYSSAPVPVLNRIAGDTVAFLPKGKVKVYAVCHLEDPESMQEWYYVQVRLKGNRRGWVLQRAIAWSREFSEVGGTYSTDWN
jgi:hypothetical protein